MIVHATVEPGAVHNVNSKLYACKVAHAVTLHNASLQLVNHGHHDSLTCSIHAHVSNWLVWPLLNVSELLYVLL